MATNDYFTLERADATIVMVAPLLETARQLKRELELIAATCHYDHTLLEQEKTRIRKVAGQLTEKLEQLEDLGCYVKDLDIGLVDFLGNFEGRDVFLCWRLGEECVTHWHEIDEGYSSRQEIVDLGDLTMDLEFEIPVIENEN
jgi:hypothetical protein